MKIKKNYIVRKKEFVDILTKAKHDAENNGLKSQLDRSKQATEDVFESWIVDLTDQDQPDACSIDDEDCEACGS